MHVLSAQLYMHLSSVRVSTSGTKQFIGRLAESACLVFVMPQDSCVVFIMHTAYTVTQAMQGTRCSCITDGVRHHSIHQGTDGYIKQYAN